MIWQLRDSFVGAVETGGGAIEFGGGGESGGVGKHLGFVAGDEEAAEIEGEAHGGEQQQHEDAGADQDGASLAWRIHPILINGRIGPAL